MSSHHNGFDIPSGGRLNIIIGIVLALIETAACHRFLAPRGGDCGEERADEGGEDLLGHEGGDEFGYVVVEVKQDLLGN